MKLVILSDTHGKHRFVAVPDGDILIFAGDMCNWGYRREVVEFNEWLGTLPHKHKIVIAGNHDLCLDKGMQRKMEIYDGHQLLTNAIYLENEGVEIEGIKFWGSPITPVFFDWAFMCREEVIDAYWNLIPKDTDVVITHGPMYKVNDYVDNDLGPERNVGSKALLKRLKEFYPRYHICGHIHDMHGIRTLSRRKTKHMTSINASILDDNYNVIYQPVVVEI